MLLFNARVFLSWTARIKELAWFCRHCQRFKGPPVSERSSMTSGGTVSNHLWCRRYKDCIHPLTALCSHCGTDNYLTVSAQRGLCGPFVAPMPVAQVCISGFLFFFPKKGLASRGRWMGDNDGLRKTNTGTGTLWQLWYINDNQA